MNNRKRYIYILLLTSLLINVYQFMQSTYNGSSIAPVTSSSSTCKTTEISDDSVDSLSCIFMNNSIDRYFIDKLNHSESEIKYEINQNAYMKAWKAEYEKILNIIENKCIYSEDKEIYVKYNKSIKAIYANLESALIPVMLNDFKLSPDSPSKNSFGQGTRDGLTMYQGMVYRNFCIIFIPYLSEYTFPTTEDLDNIVKKVTQES